MKIMLDTNILISALIFGGKAGRVLLELMETEHEIYEKLNTNQRYKGEYIGRR